MALHLFQIILAYINSLRSKLFEIWCTTSKSKLKITKRLSRAKNCQFFNSEPNPEDPMLIWPLIVEIFAWNLLHRVFGIKKCYMHHLISTRLHRTPTKCMSVLNTLWTLICMYVVYHRMTYNTLCTLPWCKMSQVLITCASDLSKNMQNH